MRFLAFKLVLLASAAGQAATTFLVSSFESSTIDHYSASGLHLGSVTGTTFSGPQGIQRGPDGLLYVADEGNNRIVRIDASTMSYHSTFVAGGGLNGPTGMAFDSQGNVLVASFNSDSIRRYNSAGAYLGDLFLPGFGGLNGPDVGLTIGPDGSLYVPSFWSNSILRYDATNGNFLGQFANSSSGLSQPRTILWRNGLMYVSSDNGNKVLRFQASTGLFLGNFVASGSGGLFGASGMAFDDQGNLLVTSWRNDRVLRFDGVTGAYMNDLAGPGNGGINGPTFIHAVPEPVTLAALGAGLAMFLKRRRS
jgi:DNA-binding beta-propeller fold protein YncE